MGRRKSENPRRRICVTLDMSTLAIIHEYGKENGMSYSSVLETFVSYGLKSLNEKGVLIDGKDCSK